jgi:hypothetical protein
MNPTMKLSKPYFMAQMRASIAMKRGISLRAVSSAA